MGVISIILLVIFIISALLLILLVMLQDEGSEGMGGIFGGSGSAQVGNRSGNILTKTTTILGAVFIIAAFGLAWFSRTPDSGDIEQAAARLRGEGGSTNEWWVQEEPEDEPGILEDLDLPDLEAETPAESE
jgi:preprotein translocase subunit SecG